MKYHITTYGCQMNVHDSEKLAGILENMEYTLADEQKDADVIVFNTCAIREGAQHRVFGNVGALKALKKQFPQKIVAVCGCMTQQSEVAKKLFETFPFVDIVIGTHNVQDLGLYITRFLQTKKRIIAVEKEKEICEGTNTVRSSGENAWVNIMYGCNNFCTFCVVPYVRGREKSRDKNQILREIKLLLLEKKYKTITLLGQNVNSYGTDKEGNGNFAQLLKDICKMEGDFKLTFMTPHPKDFSDEVIDVISAEDKILKEIHLPVQSGSSEVLRRMNRRYTREEYLNLVEKIRAKIPDVRITTDIIVGFPGETEQDFEFTCSLVERVKYDSIFAFMYSKRLNTPAMNMPNQVEEIEKHRRINHLLNLEKQIQSQKLKEAK